MLFLSVMEISLRPARVRALHLVARIDRDESRRIDRALRPKLVPAARGPFITDPRETLVQVRVVCEVRGLLQGDLARSSLECGPWIAARDSSRDARAPDFAAARGNSAKVRERIIEASIAQLRALTAAEAHVAT